MKNPQNRDNQSNKNYLGVFLRRPPGLICSDSDRHKGRVNGFALIPLALPLCLSEWLGKNLGKAERHLVTSPDDTTHKTCADLSSRLGFFGIAIISLIFSFVLQNSYASAASITLTIPSTSLSVTADPNKDSGFAKSNDATVKVSTNGSWGYELNVKAKTDNTLKNGSNKFDSIGTSIDENTFKSGTTYNNKWGFKPSKLSGSSNTNFVAAPTTSNTLIEKTSSANSSSPTSYTFAIAAKADASLPTGKYSNNFTFSATANSVSYSITYKLNDGQWTESSNTQSGSTTETSVKLKSTVPTRNNYEFLGWCSVSTTNESCPSNGKAYQPGDPYPLTSGTNAVELYAMWKATKEELLTSLVTVDSGVTQITFKVGSGIEMIMVGDPTKNSPNYWRPSYGFLGTDIVMPVTSGQKIVVSVTPKANYKLSSWTKTTGSSQTWTANGVSGTYQKMKDVTHEACVAAGEEGMNVTDERNGVSYTIGKFAERCWMFSNLRLEPGTTLTSSTSAVSSNFTLPTQADSDAWTSASQNYFSKKNMKVCKGAIGYTTSGSGGGKCADQTKGVTEYYYNWYTAIANDAVGSTPTSNTSATTDLDSQSKGSICPKNWHLHTETTGRNQINDLTTLWNENKADNPGRLVSSGSFYAGGQSNVGARGRWWSASRGSDNDGLQMRLNNGSPDAAYYTKSYACSVRCEL